MMHCRAQLRQAPSGEAFERRPAGVAWHEAQRGAFSRAHDVCARYAGDEFVLVLAACGPAEAERRARDLQTMFETVRFAPAAGELVPLHVSIGAASFPTDGVSLEAMLVVADRRMYRDKATRKRAALRLVPGQRLA